MYQHSNPIGDKTDRYDRIIENLGRDDLEPLIYQSVLLNPFIYWLLKSFTISASYVTLSPAARLGHLVRAPAL